MGLVHGKETLTKLTWSHSGSKSVWYLGELLQVVLCICRSLGSSVLVRRKPYISLVDATCNCPLYAIPFYSRRTILSPVTYPLLGNTEIAPLVAKYVTKAELRSFLIDNPKRLT